MKIVKKMISLLVSILLVTPILFVQAAPSAGLEHKIAGYGPVKGDLNVPSSSVIQGNKLYVLDTFGISIYDLASKQIDNQFTVDLGTSNSNQIWEDPKTWATFLKSFSGGLMGMMEGMLTGSGSIFGTTGSSENVLTKSDLMFDSKGNLFILTKNGIQQFDPTNGTLIKSLPIPEKDQIKPDDVKRYVYTSKIINDKFYVMQNVTDPESTTSASTIKIFIVSMDGSIEKTIPLTLTSEEITVIASDFIYLPDLDFYGLIVIDLANIETKVPFQFFNGEGKEVACSGKGLKVIPSSMDFQKPDKIVISGIPMSSGLNIGGSGSLFTLGFEKKEDGTIEIKQIKKISNKNFGFLTVDLSVTEDSVSFITTGTMESPVYDFRLFYIHDDNVVDRVGTSFYNKGQIFGSIASAVDKEGNLYETSFTNSLINKYDKNGNYVSSIDMDLKVISSLMGLLTLFPTIMDMTIDGDYLYCNNLLPGSINRYSFKDNSWEQIYTVDIETMMDQLNLWFTMKMENGTMFLLDSANLNDGAPNLSFLNEDSEIVPINLADSPTFDTESSPVFMGFIMTDTEYQFLDSIQQEIWIYNRLEKKFMNKVALPKNPKGFYTSFDLYPDGSWIISDVVTCELLHVAKSGELIETIGKKGSVTFGQTKEAYHEKKDQFDMPIRVKAANNQLYVSDLLNCRYHIIPLGTKPEIKWEKDSLTVEKFNVFNEEIFDINFSATPKTDMTFTEPWMQLKSETGKASDQKISVKILGDKLTCWKSNQGFIQISFKDYPELSKKIPVTVDAVGNIVHLTIGSNKAIVNGKDTLIDKTSIPMIVKGRTFVGVRFMGEVVFNNLAKINFDAKTQTVFYELGSKKIELYIGKSYALVNGVKVNLDVPPFILSGRTFVPLRFVSENLDASVAYDAKTQTITISYPGK
jgi:hypothetical protein